MLFSPDRLLEAMGHDERSQGLFRLAVACVALVALFAEAYAEIDGGALSPRAKTWGGRILGALAVCAYTQMFQLGIPHYVHRSEVFHYYLGSKFSSELGYERLYSCAAVAEAELGFAADVRTRKLRDLHRNVLVPAGPLLDDPAACKDHFSAERWSKFVADVRFFRSVADPSYWRVMQGDHGYNATPGWGMLGKLLANAHPATLGYVRLLAFLDVALMCGLLAVLRWGFGRRVALLALVFWGTQGATTIFWTGGAFLRQEWLFLLVLSAALLRKRHALLAGVALGCAAISRGFPAAFLLGPLFVAVFSWLRDRKLAAIDVRLFGGVALAVGCLLPLSVAVMGRDAWPAFASHIAMHDGTPTTNRMGFRNVVAHSSEGRMARMSDREGELEHWKSIRRDTLQRRKWAVYAGIILAVGLLALAASRLRSRWLALCLGVVVPTFALGLTCYYYSFFVLAAPLSRARRQVEIGLLVTSVLTNLAALHFRFYDDRYVAMTVAFSVFSLWAVAMFIRRDALLPAVRRLLAT